MTRSSSGTRKTLSVAMDSGDLSAIADAGAWKTVSDAHRAAILMEMDSAASNGPAATARSG